MKEPHFNGPEYDESKDYRRLSDQHLRVRELMLDHRWRTLRQIANLTGDPEASISAQLRHMKKKRFGSYVLERRPKGNRDHGLFEYRVSPPGTIPEYPDRKERRNKYKEALAFVWKHESTTGEVRRGILEIVNGKSKDNKR